MYFLACKYREPLETKRGIRKKANFNPSKSNWVTTHVLGSRNFSPAFLPAGAMGGRPGEWLAPLISIILKTDFLTAWENSDLAGKGELLARLEAGWGQGEALSLSKEPRHCFTPSCKEPGHNHLSKKDYPGTAHNAISLAFNQLQAAWVKICMDRGPNQPPAGLDELLDNLYSGAWKPSLLGSPGAGAGDAEVQDLVQPGVGQPDPVPLPLIQLAEVNETDVQSAEAIVRLKGAHPANEAGPSAAETESDAGGSGSGTARSSRPTVDAASSGKKSNKRKSSTGPKQPKAGKTSGRESDSSSASNSGPSGKRSRSNGDEK